MANFLLNVGGEPAPHATYQDMKKFFAITLLMASSVAAMADLNGDGYYRVENYKTHRYASVIDNRGSIDIATTTADLQAIKLWRVFDDICHDAGSIFYITKVGSGDDYNLSSQGTSVYQIIDHYLKLRVNGSADGQSLYMAYGTNGKVTRNLGDGNTLNRDYGTMTTNASGDYRKWFILPVNAESANFFGVLPDVNAGGSLYGTLYASFPFSVYSQGVKAYYVSNVSSTLVELTEIKGTVPPGTPVVMECAGATPSDNRLNVGGSASSIEGNKLLGQYFNCDIYMHVNRVAYDPATMRVLGRCADGSLGFVTAENLDYIPANTAYLTVPAGYSRELKCVFDHDSFTSDVDDMKADSDSSPKSVYTINGVLIYREATEAEISSLPKGIYVIGGKKVKI